MSNFEYIVASLPYLTRDYSYEAGRSWDSVIQEIRDNLSEKDNALLDLLLKGFAPEGPDRDFYLEALSSKNRFIKDFFNLDLRLRNAKVNYLNEQLGRTAGEDIMRLSEDEDAEEFQEGAAVQAVLSREDLLEREKGLDDIYWEKADNLSLLHYFDITAILAYVAKLHIADRWLTLDEERGRELFRKLVDEIRGTFKGVKSLNL